MDRIGKVDGRGPSGQLDHVALWRETKDLIRIHLKLDRFEEFVMVIFPLKLFVEGGDPFSRIYRKGVFRAHAIAIGPMGRHTGFGHIMHLGGSDLHLDPFAIPA